MVKNLSHFVKPQARLLKTSGQFNNLLAFINPDRSIVFVLQKDTGTDRRLRIKLGNRNISALLRANTFKHF
jgi:glucosylceramidase